MIGTLVRFVMNMVVIILNTLKWMTMSVLHDNVNIDPNLIADMLCYILLRFHKDVKNVTIFLHLHTQKVRYLRSFEWIPFTKAILTKEKVPSHVVDIISFPMVCSWPLMSIASPSLLAQQKYNNTTAHLTVCLFNLYNYCVDLSFFLLTQK